VICTICDSGTNNVAALKSLGVTENTPYFLVGNDRIYAVFDPPHLLKCLRNMLKIHGKVFIDAIITIDGKKYHVKGE